jgi:hypothetical protein
MVLIIPKQITNSFEVAGFNNQKHLRSLGKFVSKLPKESRVLEVGVGFGGSTWEFLDSLPENSELHSCDTFGMNHPQLKAYHAKGVLAKHSHNSAIVWQMKIYQESTHRACFDWAVKQHPRYRTVMKKVHECTSLEVLKGDLNWDCVYLDGHHAYETVSKELELCSHVPYMCGDDYHPAHPGCQQAISEWVEKTGRHFEHDTYESGSGFWFSIKE